MAPLVTGLPGVGVAPPMGCQVMGGGVGWLTRMHVGIGVGVGPGRNGGTTTTGGFTVTTGGLMVTVEVGVVAAFAAPARIGREASTVVAMIRGRRIRDNPVLVGAMLTPWLSTPLRSCCSAEGTGASEFQTTGDVTGHAVPCGCASSVTV